MCSVESEEALSGNWQFVEKNKDKTPTVGIFKAQMNTRS